MTVDPSTFEIIRHKFFRVIDESIVALMNVSGSAITNEGHDVMVSLYREDGKLLMGGVGFLHHVTCASQACKQIVKRFSNDPGIDEDDAFILNDPYSGDLHTPDIYLIMPIHYKGRLVAWTANFVNVADIGAIDAGGFCPRATEIYQEGFSTPGLKLIERGKVRKDILDTILNMVRDPGMVALDLRSQIAACNVAKRRFLDVIEKYGWEAVDEVSNTLISQSETLLRRRLSELPDGIWRAREYMDMPDRTYKYRLAMEKKHDELIFDFSGSSEQAPISVNCTYWATYGGVFAPLFPLLCHDITWNDGVTKPVSVSAPEGTIVNCKKPAPVSVATVTSLKIVNNLATLVLSKMLMTSPKYKDEATAVWQGTHTAAFWYGINQFKEFFVTPVTDGFGGSAGARTFRDGVDVGGEIANVFSRWANIETHEQDTPVLYLFRKRLLDSGGPGMYRGGISHEYAVVPYDAPYGEISANVFAKGVAVPLSHGLSGGYPGNTAEASIFKQARVLGQTGKSLPDGGESIKAEKEFLRWGVFPIKTDEVFYVRQVGAGGYGDPLDREAGAVLTDFREGLVSMNSAKNVYGVVFDHSGDRLDEGATNQRRKALRDDRLKHSRANMKSIGKLEGESTPTGFMLNEYVQIVRASGGKGYFRCSRCGRVISGVDSKWKEHALMRESAVAPPVGLKATDVGKFLLREFFCDGCGTLLDVEVAERGEELIHDEIRI